MCRLPLCLPRRRLPQAVPSTFAALVRRALCRRERPRLCPPLGIRTYGWLKLCSRHWSSCGSSCSGGRAPSSCARRRRTRSHIVLSRLSASFVGVEALTRSPDAPDDGQRLGHAVADCVHGRLALLTLATIVLVDDRVVLDADNGHSIES